MAVSLAGEGIAEGAAAIRSFCRACSDSWTNVSSAVYAMVAADSSTTGRDESIGSGLSRIQSHDGEMVLKVSAILQLEGGKPGGNRQRHVEGKIGGDDAHYIRLRGSRGASGDRNQ